MVQCQHRVCWESRLHLALLDRVLLPVSRARDSLGYAHQQAPLALASREIRAMGSTNRRSKEEEGTGSADPFR